MMEKRWIIEFRNGSFFTSLAAEHGGTRDAAMRFASKEEAERYMAKHTWIVFNGGMVMKDRR